MQQVLDTGIEASNRLLNSGHIVLQIGIVLVCILLGIIVVMYRHFSAQIKEKDAEIKRLTNVIIQIEEKVITTVNNLRTAVKEITAHLNAYIRSKK